MFDTLRETCNTSCLLCQLYLILYLIIESLQARMSVEDHHTNIGLIYSPKSLVEQLSRFSFLLSPQTVIASLCVFCVVLCAVTNFHKAYLERGELGHYHLDREARQNPPTGSGTKNETDAWEGKISFVCLRWPSEWNTKSMDKVPEKNIQ